MGYVKGVAEVLDFQKRIHLPVGVTNGKLYDTVIDWLSSNSEKRRLAALDVIYLALRQHFPPSVVAKQ
jgi:Rap1a immunity proteins